MSAVFIISFDCEGKWGVADHLDARLEALFTTPNLLQNYRDLVALLEDFAMRASFAFVGAYTLSAEEFLDRRADYAPVLSSAWCRPLTAALQRRAHDGWFNPEAARLVARAGVHEIAAHGFSHRPLAPSDASVEDVRWELAALRRLELFRGRPWTLVFPRNEVAFVEELPAYGIVGYRGRRQRPGGGTRWVRLVAEECSAFATADEHAGDETPVRIPAGFFLNWRSGARRLVPPRVTIRRWASLLRDAARHDRVVHLRSHPHNFLTGHGMLPLFREILRVAAAMSRSEDLVNLTQLEYAERVRRARAPASTATRE